MRLRTSLILSLQNIINRNNGFKLKVGDLKALKTDRVAPYLAFNEDLALAGKVRGLGVRLRNKRYWS